MMSLFDLIVLILEIFLYTFHFSLLIVLIVNRKTKFVGPFYNMLRILFISDIVLFLSTFEFRIAEYGLWKAYFKTDTFFATFGIHSTTYLFYLQFSIHALIPFNRFTLFYFPFLYKKIWSKQWYTVLIIFVPLIVLAPVIKERCIFVYAQNDAIIFPSLENTNNTTSYLLIMLIYSATMTTAAAIFNFFAILKYYFQRKRHLTNSSILKKEIPILYISCVTFIAHLFYCLIMAARITFNDNPVISSIVNVIWFLSTDIIAASGSISVIIICKNARKTYIEFYKNLNNLNAESRIFTLSKMHPTVKPVFES